MKKGLFMRKEKNLKLNLQLFAENGGEGVASESGGEQIADAGQEIKEEFSGTDEEFESLIDGKFKEQFRKRTQSIIDKRFKETKLLEDYKNRVSPLIEKLNEKYGVQDGDTDALQSKLFSEENNNETENQQNSLLEARRQSLKQKVVSWVKESEDIKAIYPDFDLRNELKSNPLFGKLLHNGVNLKDAYEVVHKDEILGGAMAYTAQKVREQVVKGIEAKGRRPLENGISSESGIVTLTDVNALTSKDILKILKQVENGVSVKF